MQGITCFGLDWWRLYHAGEDWYRADGKSASQAEVTAVANGNVKYISYDFPGAVILIRHRLPPDGQLKIFSLYGHLDPNSVQVSVGQIVSRGQKLGTVLLQYYDGRYTDLHDDSHLHFEMRDFYDGSAIYTDYPYCNGYIPGRGYTYPQLPDVFPSSSSHYTDPITYIQLRPRAFLPLIMQEPLPGTP
jgi:murein DD-endopeptidase MepM/ murein hydrolase activator NlpD